MPHYINRSVSCNLQTEGNTSECEKGTHTCTHTHQHECEYKCEPVPAPPKEIVNVALVDDKSTVIVMYADSTFGSAPVDVVDESMFAHDPTITTVQNLKGEDSFNAHEL